ncbi:MAG TPA: hypothetical protein VLF62_01970 [Candidatus Saccharimonadales bacterium]|jgi:hypothetical protein|nr:hypothetical protein [Candidatus Saccharimonadales bacterium]
MNEAMTQIPQAEVNAQFDMMAQQMANDGLLEAVMAMQNIDMNSDNLMQDAAVAVGRANLATAGLTADVNESAMTFQAQAAEAQERAVRASINELFSEEDEEDLANA